MDRKYRHIEKALRKAGFSPPIYTDPLNTLVKGTDAGIYRLIPKMVVQVNNEQEVIMVLKICSGAGVPVTFKAGGTSLCGQTVTDSVLVETGPLFNRYVIGPGGAWITLEPGITGGRANAVLARYNRKIGPSPASVASAKIGGIIANNASGASYGIATNSYNTLKGLRLVMADGSVLDTLDEQSRSVFAESHPELVTGIRKLSERVKHDPGLTAKIRHKYELKNTTGYGLNSLLDFDDPLDILWHLMIGSEGTLGFISEATFTTVNSFPYSAAALVFLPDIGEACKAIIPLRNCAVSAAELMDRNALHSVENDAGIPGVIRTLDENCVALLIDTTAPDRETLNNQITDIVKALEGIRTVHNISFITDPWEYNRIWKVRKGLFASAAATRPGGTACLIEDVAFRADVLGQALKSLRSLISKYNYHGSVMWGHLLDGNVHFVIMPDFRDQQEVEKYSEFMDRFVKLTVEQFDGSLKAEHGTGRNMAPFVRYEWGSELYQVMKEIKQLFDPHGILNPGVILNEDSLIHIKNLKPIPEVNETIDACIECGFCENDCPSKNLTLTPRQRIVAYREIVRTDSIKKYSSYSREIQRKFQYGGDATCATDGLCALACPVNINTGTLIKELRFEKHSIMSNRLADIIANNLHLTTSLMRGTLNFIAMLHRMFGTWIMQGISGGLHRLTGRRIPLWNRYMPAGSKLRSLYEKSPSSDQKVVYFPTCINRTMGKSADYRKSDEEVAVKTKKLLEKAGFEVIIPQGVERLCCGMAFDSKGFKAQGNRKAKELEQALMAASDGGKIPVYCDMSPCLLRMKEALSDNLKLYETVEFILKYVAPQLEFKKLSRKVAVHSTCSSVKMGLTADLIRLASLCCTGVLVPDDIGCCGWAGDRGFTHPELNASALKPLKKQITNDVKEGYSTSRTCETGLSLHSGISYKSIVYLVDEATAPKP